MGSNPPRVPLAVRCLAVLFAAALLTCYVLYAQQRADAPSTPAERVLAPSSKSRAVLPSSDLARPTPVGGAETTLTPVPSVAETSTTPRPRTFASGSKSLSPPLPAATPRPLVVSTPTPTPVVTSDSVSSKRGATAAPAVPGAGDSMAKPSLAPPRAIPPK